MNPFVERHQEEVAGVLWCFDRVVVTGTLPDIGHAGAMAQWLGSRGIRLFDYTQWTEPLREELRRNAERLAAEAGLAIVRTAVHVVQAEHVATFLGHKLTGNVQGEVGNDFSTRIRHTMGPASIKLYDKLALRARVECTVQR